MGQAYTTYGDRRGACRGLVGRPKGKRPLGRTSHGWEYNTKVHHKEIRWEDVDWIHLAEDRDR